VCNDDCDDIRLRLFDALGRSSLMIYLCLGVAVGFCASLSSSSPLVQRTDEREECPEQKLDVTVEAGCAGTSPSDSN
jgi:hypothetical protein